MKEKNWADLFGAEWERIKRYGKAIVEPDEKQVFWDTVREMKAKDPHWSFDSIQPVKRNATEKAMHECCSYVFGLRKPKKEESA